MSEVRTGAARPAPHETAVEAEDVVVRDGRAGPVAIRIYRPLPHPEPLPTLIYARGSEPDDARGDGPDRLARALAARSGAAVALPDHGGRPGDTGTAELERCYAAAAWAAARGAVRGLDGRRIAVAGDSGGAALAVALTLLARRRGEPGLAAQLLLCPALHGALPDGLGRVRTEGLPAALVITAEEDAVRDHGEAYAIQLRAGGVTVAAVRYLGVGAGFVATDRAWEAGAAAAAIAQAGEFVAAALRSPPPACGRRDLA